MNETPAFNLEFHAFSSILLGIFLLAHLALVRFGDTNNFSYLKRLMLFLPAYYGILAFIIFSGILALAFLHFTFSLKVLIMILCAAILIALGAKGNKELKKARILRNFGAFKSFMYKKILCEIAILALAYAAGAF